MTFAERVRFELRCWLHRQVMASAYERPSVLRCHRCQFLYEETDGGCRHCARAERDRKATV